MDIEGGLAGFEDQSFNHVIISQALQAILATERILSEMLRVAEEAVISFPHFAYRANREAIANGHVPVSEDLPYEWYETPNVRFFTIADFEDFCRDRNLRVHRRVALDTEAKGEVFDHPNLNADLAIFVISRA